VPGEPDTVLIPPMPQAPEPPGSQSGWRTDVSPYEGTVVAEIVGSIAGLGRGTDPHAGYETMGAPRTAGKRYFEIRAINITSRTNVGLAVGAYPVPTVSLPSVVEEAQWLQLYGGGGAFVKRSYTPALGWYEQKAKSWHETVDGSWPWEESGQYFKDGSTYGFAVDLDTGTLDKVFLNSMEIYPEWTAPSDLTELSPLAQWAPGEPVQPYLSVRQPHSTVDAEIWLATSPTQFRYRPPAGYEPWDGGVMPPAPPTPADPSPTASGWRTDVVEYDGAIPDINGASAKWSSATASRSWYATMGAGIRTTGKRYFEIRGVHTSPDTAVGFAVGTYGEPDVGDVPGQWCQMFHGNLGGAFDGTSAPNSSFEIDVRIGTFHPGDVYGFLFDLDVGRVDSVRLNGVEVFPASVPDAGTYPTTWAPNSPVQAYLSWGSGASADGSIEGLEVVLATEACTFAHEPPAGYVAWDAP